MAKKICLRTLVVLVVILMTAFVIAGCGADEEEPPDDSIAFWELAADGDATDLPAPEKPDESYTIGVVLPHLANPHFLGHAYGYYTEAEALGAEVVLFEAGGYTHLERQMEQWEDLISLPVDALILVAVSAEGTVPMVDQAAEAGIPVVNVNVMTASDKVVTRVRSDDYEIGQMHAEYMSEKLGGEGKVLVLAGPAGTSWANDRSKGFLEYMEENEPGIEILDTRFLDSEPSAGLKEMEDALLAYDQIDGVMTGSDFLGVGVAQAIEAAGVEDEIVVTTTDSQEDCINAIRKGSIDATVVQSPVFMGKWGIRAAILTLEGKGDQLVKRYWTPLNIVDQTNVDDFEFGGISRPPADWQLP